MNRKILSWPAWLAVPHPHPLPSPIFRGLSALPLQQHGLARCPIADHCQEDLLVTASLKMAFHTLTASKMDLHATLVMCTLSSRSLPGNMLQELIMVRNHGPHTAPSRRLPCTQPSDLPWTGHSESGISTKLLPKQMDRNLARIYRAASAVAVSRAMRAVLSWSCKCSLLSPS